MNPFRRMIAVGLLVLVLPFTAALQPVFSADPPPPVYVVLFTHIEDNCPAGTLGSEESRQNYFIWRQTLIATAELFRKNELQWVFEPDWTFLLAGLEYETDSVTTSTNGKNLFRHLKEDLGVAIDPHSHENGGYSYTDVAHLLDSLGVGGSTVMGGHIWDPTLPQFQDWDRFRVPVRGSVYPRAVWRGDILMGHGTPNHVNDPHVSGVWRPKDRDHFFEHDPAGNIVAVGQCKESRDDTYGSVIRYLNELTGLYASGTVPAGTMLTLTTHLSPGELNAPHSFRMIEDSILVPLARLQTQGKAKVTDFTTLVMDWENDFGSDSFIYDPDGSTPVERAGEPLPENYSLLQNHPNPFNPSTCIVFRLPVSDRVTVRVYDMMGREAAVLADRFMASGSHRLEWNASGFESGVYFCRIQAGEFTAVRKMVLMK